MNYTNPSDFDETPRPLVMVINEHPAAFEIAPHSHARAQLLYAAKGVVVVSTPDGAWVAPAERAVWIPAGVMHATRMVGEVSACCAMLRTDACPWLGPTSRVISVSPLLRSLLLAAAEIPRLYDVDGRDGLVAKLLMAELEAAPTVPLAAPFPQHPALATRCRIFLEAPDVGQSIDDWSEAMGMNRRRFTRLFRRETGMSFAEWRQQACLLAALPRLGAGEPVTIIALDLGYDSPSAFTTMFKRVLGMSPSRYRLQDAA